MCLCKGAGFASVAKPDGNICTQPHYCVFADYDGLQSVLANYDGLQSLTFVLQTRHPVFLLEILD